MLSRCRTELICDFAETYRIYDLFSMPANLVATLAVGLGLNSRTKTKIMGLAVPIDTFLLAGAIDRLSFLCWSKTDDARKGINPPKLILPKLMGQEESTLASVKTPEDFDIAWKKATGQEG